MKKTFDQVRESFKEMTVNKTSKRIAYTLAAFIVLLVVFQAGITVGFRKAHFARSWNDHYFENFGPRKNSFVAPMPGQFPNAHGTTGKIISANLPTIIVEDRDKTEKIITITDATKIRKMNTDGTSADLAVDTYIVVVGYPNDQGQITAKFIRIIPAPPVQQ